MTAQHPEIAEEIAEEAFGEVIGASSDGSRFVIQADKLSKLETRMAVRNGFVVSDILDDRNSEYKFRIEFTRLGFMGDNR